MTTLYVTKNKLLAGTDYEEVIAKARQIYHLVQKQTPRRQPYVRSRHFKNDKVFINQFWVHLNQKQRRDRLRRLKCFPCGLEVIRSCPYKPDTTPNPNKAGEILHRYTAQTKTGVVFYVQVRENKLTGRKDFMSAFPKARTKK